MDLSNAIGIACLFSTPDKRTCIDTILVAIPQEPEPVHSTVRRRYDSCIRSSPVFPMLAHSQSTRYITEPADCYVVRISLFCIIAKGLTRLFLSRVPAILTWRRIIASSALAIVSGESVIDKTRQASSSLPHPPSCPVYYQSCLVSHEFVGV